MGILQSGTKLSAQWDKLFPGDAIAALDDAVERLAADILHDVKWRPLVLAAGMKLHDVGMLELLEDGDLALERAVAATLAVKLAAMSLMATLRRSPDGARR